MRSFGHTKHAVAWLASLWGREYHDLRIILEQQQGLSYVSFSARFQKIAARSAIVTLFGVVGALVGLTSYSAYLLVTRSDLERSHKEIFQALIASSTGLNLPTEELSYSQADMVLLAQTIRERDEEIRSALTQASFDLALKNQNLDQRVEDTGLTKEVISIIQSNSGMGGFGRDVEEGSGIASSMTSELKKQDSENQRLRTILDALPARMPVQDYYVTSKFGFRKHPITQKRSFHSGVDMVTRSDDAVFPAKAGLVVLARKYYNYGNSIILRHENGVETLYAHLDKILVKEGDQVNLDTQIGVVGNTGQSTGKHLHFEVSVGGYPVDPYKVISTANYVRQNQKEKR